MQSHENSNETTTLPQNRIRKRKKNPKDYHHLIGLQFGQFHSSSDRQNDRTENKIERQKGNKRNSIMIECKE